MVKTALAMEDPSFEEWTATEPFPSQRLGQWLYNTAPAHIQSFANGVLELDPFHVEDGKFDRLYVLNNFLLFAYLVWDETDPDEMKLAFRLVMQEPNARRH